MLDKLRQYRGCYLDSSAPYYNLHIDPLSQRETVLIDEGSSAGTS